MYGEDKAAEELDRTAFRRAEKQYKLYYDDSFKSSKKKKKPKPVDVSDVLDFKAITDTFSQNGEVPSGITVHATGGLSHPVFCLESRPGFCFIPAALTVEEQSHWVRESLTSFPQPPNRTNHNAIYGPISNLFDAAREGKVLVEDCSMTGASEGKENARGWKFLDEGSVKQRGNGCKSVLASILLRKLRWSTLGLQFDWSQRNYNVSLPHNKIPEALCQVARKMAAPSLSPGEEFKPEAAIVNYFSSGDTLGGHLDDMEKDWSRPIVSMSLGCKAIFLLGGKSRQETPTAMFLRSGDIVLMAGEARECFHGVPRIFTDQENAEIDPLELQFSNEEDSCFLDYIRSSRININIRQVF